MAEIVKNHVELNFIDEYGDVNKILPATDAEDVSISRDKNKNIPAGLETAQDVIDNLGASAFKNAEELLYIGYGNEIDEKPIETEINDSTVSDVTTWSSKKIKTYIDGDGSNFIPDYISTEEYVSTYLPIIPHVINVNTSGFSPKNYPNGTPGNYIVEYIPFVNRETNTPTIDMRSGTRIDYAMQRWTKLPTSNVSMTEFDGVYIRFFINGEWTNFMHNVNGAYTASWATSV